MSDSSKRLSIGEKLSYGLGDTASNFFFQTFNIFLLYYYTDVFGLGAAAAGTLFLAARSVDMVSDPLMGYAADRTNTRWGKFRPYLIWISIPYGIIGYMLFANPSLSESGKLFYAYATYIAMMLAYTAINIPYSALLGVITPSSSERTAVASYRFFCAFGGGLLISMFVRPLVKALGGENEALGFQLTMAVFAVISIGLFFLTFWGTKERVQPPKEQSSNLKEDLKALLLNRAWLMLFFAAIFTMANVAVRNGATVYYFKYYVGDDGAPYLFVFDRTTVVMTLGMLGLITGVVCSKPLSNYMDKRSILIWFSILNAVTIALFFFIPPEQFFLMALVSFVGSLLAGPTVPVVWAMYADTADFGEWRWRRRSTGLVFSAALFAQKFGLAIGGAVSGWALGLLGFVANQDQTPMALLGIRVLFTLAPACMALLAVGAIYFYPLRDKEMAQIEIDLGIRKSQKTSETLATGA